MKQLVLGNLFVVPVEDLKTSPLASGREAETFTTSIQAAHSVDDTKAQQRALVYQCIKEAGANGRTDDEIQQILGLDGSSERPRRLELWQAKRIYLKNGAVRPTRTGRSSTIWFAV